MNVGAPKMHLGESLNSDHFIQILHLYVSLLYLLRHYWNKNEWRRINQKVEIQSSLFQRLVSSICLVGFHRFQNTSCKNKVQLVRKQTTKFFFFISMEEWRSSVRDGDIEA